MSNGVRNPHHEGSSPSNCVSVVTGVIKEPDSVGPLLTFRDDDAPGGLRGPTDAENDTKEIQEKLVDAVDASAYESGDEVVEIHIHPDGGRTIEWLIDDHPEVPDHE